MASSVEVMKMKILTVLLLGLCLLMGSLVIAQFPSRLIREEGFVVDEVTLQESANPKSKRIVLDHHRDGAKLVFCTTAGKIYHLADQAGAVEKVGQKYAIVASYRIGEGLTVSSWQEPQKKKKQKPKTEDS
jgi:hypothetical protein